MNYNYIDASKCITQYNKAYKLQSLKPTLENSTEAIVTQANIKNPAIPIDGISIEILNDDCITKILLRIDNTLDFKKFKCLNKRICKIINSNNELQIHAYCLSFSPRNLFSLPKSYLLSVNRQLEEQTKTASNNNYSNIKHTAIPSKGNLFFSIEKKLSQAKEIGLQEVETVLHSNTINSISFSEDNNFFATASADNTAKIYKSIGGTWQYLCVLSHEEPITKTTISPDNRYIITTSIFFHTIWDISTTPPQQKNSIDNLHGSFIYFRDDSKRLLIESKYKSMKTFDLIENNWTCILSLSDNDLCSIFDINQDDVSKFSLELELVNSDNWLSSIIKVYSVYSMLNTISTESSNSSLAANIKDMVFGKRWRNLKSYDQPGTNIFIPSKNMQLIYAHSRFAGGVILEHINNRWQLKFTLPDSAKSPCFSSDNQRLITDYAYGDKQIYETTIWNISGNQPYKELVLTDTYTTKFSQDSKYVIALDTSRRITIWHFIDNAWRIKSAIKTGSSTPYTTVKNVCFSNYNWMIATLGNNTATVSHIINTSKITDKTNNLALNKEIIFNEIANIPQVDNIFFSSIGNYFITTNNNIAQLWYTTVTNSLQAVTTLEHKDNIDNILFSPDNSHIIISSNLHTTIWGIMANRYSKKITIQTEEKPYIDFKDNGERILIAEINKPIQIFSLVNDNWQADLAINNTTDAIAIQESIFVFVSLIPQVNNDSWLSFALQRYAIVEVAHKKQNNSIYFGTPQIETNSFDTQVQNIIYSDTHRAYSFFLPKLDIISYSPDNQLMYLGFSNNNCIILENNNSRWGKKLIFNGATNKACFSSDNQRIITISKADKNSIAQMIIWNISTENAFQELGVKNINSASFSPDNKHIVTTSIEDKTVHIWSLINDRWQVGACITNDSIPCNANFSTVSNFISIVYQDKTAKIFSY